MYRLFCVVLCIVCLYMCTVRLPPGSYPIAVKCIVSYHILHSPSADAVKISQLTASLNEVHFSGLCSDCAKLKISFFIANLCNLIIGYWADKLVLSFTKQALLYGCTKSTVLSGELFWTWCGESSRAADSISVTALEPVFSSMTTGYFLLLFQMESIAVIVLASIGYSVLTPINLLQTERGKKEANEGDEILLEGITCTYFCTA